MKRIFITGSSTGLGFLAAKELITAGNEVYVHARNEEKANGLRQQLPGLKAILIGDLSKFDELKELTREVNKLGKLDAIIHNAGIYDNDLHLNDINMTRVFYVNVFAPYFLTENVVTPERLIYLSSDLHYSGNFDIQNLQFEKSRWTSSQAYNDSKLLLTILCMYFSKKYPESFVSSVDPGWVPTRMGGKSATDDIVLGYETQVWLSTSDSKEARVTGKYFFHMQEKDPKTICLREEVQNELVSYLENLNF